MCRRNLAGGTESRWCSGMPTYPLFTWPVTPKSCQDSNLGPVDYESDLESQKIHIEQQGKFYSRVNISLGVARFRAIIRCFLSEY